jgi:hypothetical protein
MRDPHTLDRYRLLDRHGNDQEGAAVKDRLADVVAARIAFLENAVDDASQ